MRFLADENFPRPGVLRLREAGYQIEWVAEIAPGAPDTQVLAHAREHGQVLLTFDRDFGELIYRQRLSVPPGVVHLRFVPGSPTESADILLDLFRREGLELVGRFTVLERDRVRQRPLLRAT
jgi:predicted nuclease of predicted toxin-antitoxin system